MSIATTTSVAMAMMNRKSFAYMQMNDDYFPAGFFGSHGMGGVGTCTL